MSAQAVYLDPRSLLLEFGPLTGERERGEWVARRLGELGFIPQRDELGNIWAGHGQGLLLLVAHIDTVLTPAPVRQQGEKWFAPAVGDNSAGVAVLLSLAPLLLPLGIGLGFSVGEEGLGNLKGARALVARLAPRMVVAVDGYMPGVVTEAVGSVRLRGLFVGPGGHAWGDRANPSPMPALGQAIAALYELKQHEDMSVNVGRVWGGEAINAIPVEVGFELDLRASKAAMLEQLEAQAREVLMSAAQKQGVRLELEVLGRRPAGSTATPEMQRAAQQALAEVGQEVHWLSGSTDASAAVEAGIPALAFGTYRGGGAHTPEEWVEPESLVEGARALWALVRNLRGL